MRRSPSDTPGVLGAITRFWQRSYAPDYLGLVLLLAAYQYEQFFVDPFHRMFSLDDRAKQYPHALVQRVSSVQNILYSGAAPLVILILWAGVRRPGVHQAHVTILGLIISVTLASFLTDLLKNAVGRPRPDLIARCKPEKGTPEHSLITIAACTEADGHTLQDGWRSFPSGHSSFAFAGLGYLALFLAGQLRLFHPHADLARVLLCLTPLLGAALIAMSRLADYRHDVYDITCGSLLGIFVAYFSYRRYYRPLKHSKCDEPYPSRFEYALTGGLGRGADVEQVQAEDFTLEELTEDEAESHPLTQSQARPP